MGEANGSLKATNGHANGHREEKQARTLKRKVASRKRRGFGGWLFNQVARLSAWFVLLTIAFRCPQTLKQCDETSPFVCPYYFRAKAMVLPQVKPYYDHYAAPYVDVAYPVYDMVDTHVLSPARTYAVHYGAPYVQQAQAYGRTQWEKSGQPQLEHYQTLAMNKYVESIAPHIATASDTLAPYYNIAVTNGHQIYYEHLLPSYALVQPYLAQGYNKASDFAATTILPSAYWAFNTTYVFVETALWPQVRVLYSQNVEPQLVRIGERLGRYKNKMANSTPIIGSKDARDDSKPQPALSKSNSQRATSASAIKPVQSSEHVIPRAEDIDADDLIKPVAAPEVGENELDVRKKAREMVTQDLDTWQTKFATQADEGANAIGDRISEITKELEQNGALTKGRDLVDKLDATIRTELESLKRNISAVIGSMADDEKSATDVSVSAIRSAGMAIKDAASAVRDWRQDYDDNLQKEVTNAADAHFQILDETRNLAMQQLGMRWAWTDGITYKDWAKYHELKQTLGQWTDQLKELVVTDPNLLKAQEASAQVEDESMQLASKAAKELGRLKQVAQWKIMAKDATDNFESDAMRLGAEAVEAAQPVNRKAEEKVNAARKITAHQAEKAQKEAAKRAAQVKEDIVKPVAAAASSVSGYANSAASNAATYAQEATASVVGLANAAIDAVADKASAASGAAEGQSTASSQSASIVLSEGETATSKAGEELSATHSGASGQVPEAADNTLVVEEDPLTAREDTPKVDQTASIKPAFLGAAAQEVPAERKPILEDYVDTDIVSNAVAAAEAAYSGAMAAAYDQYSSAMSVVSAQVYGTPKPVHEQLFSSVSGAYENAVGAARAKYDEALLAASRGLKRAPETPTPTALVDWSKVESIASQRLNEGRLWAEVQYQSALIALGIATATPTSTSDKVLQEAKKNYYAGLGLAQERYAQFLSAASSAMYSLTATPTPTNLVGTASSLASVAQETVVSVVNAAEDAVGSAYSVATDNVAGAISAVDNSIQSAIDGASEQMYLAGAAVAETWDKVISDINLQIYGAEPSQIGWYDNLLNDATSAAGAVTDAAEGSFATASAGASKQYEAVSNLMSELMNDKEPSYTNSVLSRLGEVYATAASNVGSFASEASAAASSIGSKVNSAAGQATEAVKEPGKHVRDEL